MSLLASLLKPETMLLDIPALDRDALFDAIDARLSPALGLAPKLIALSLAAREKLGSTGLGQGVAIPHGRIKQLKQATCVFVRTQHPIPFDAPDHEPVRLLFVLLVPERATDLHLQLLSELAQALSDRQLRERLLAVTSAQEAMTLLAP